MGFNEFTGKVLEYFKKELGEGYKIDLLNITKNNGVNLLGLRVLNIEENIAPCIYLDQYYEMFLEKNGSEEVFETIMDNYLVAAPFKCELESFSDFEKIKHLIFSKVINTEKNKELLKEVPHREILDWSVVYYMKLPLQVLAGTVLIKNCYLDMWGIEPSILECIANTNNGMFMPIEISGIEKVIGDIVETQNINDLENSWENDSMIIVTNTNHMYGANALFYEGVLEHLANRKESDLFILPSSVHELILLQDDGKLNASELQRMVIEVNKSIVDKEEILSDHVYKYSRESEKIIIVA